ncbi:MAG: flap endonuclease [Actinobacteria bacterium]|nr:flap endonuclease [Actinomycetota bacterium]MBU1493484.1 flap endonuclease [Actinomycetota bacterium]MBU1864996.1 flap endonuclease [Actinomycetota bacterium]
MRVHLLDGTYELFRAHFGSPPRTAPTGEQISAVHGLMATTLKLVQEEGVTHLGAAFDSEVLSFRNDLFPAYKTDEGMPPELLAQFPWAEEALEALGVVVWRMIDFEADDALATAAWKYSDDAEQVVILSPDKDMAQCVVGESPICFDRRQQIFMNEQGVWDKFGVAPESIPDYLGLMGDSSDGIPGIPAWGAKSSSAVLAEYGHIEYIPLDAAEWKVPVRGAERLAASLREHRDEALLYRRLATVRRDVPITESIADLQWHGVPRARFFDFCDRWGFTNLRSRPQRWAG